MRIIFLILALILSVVGYSQIGLNTKLVVNNPERITITISDSSDYNPKKDSIPPSIFTLVFEKDSLISVDFHYKVFGLVEASNSKTIIQEAELVHSKNSLSLFFYYNDSEYGTKWYVLNGSLQESIKGKEYNFVPTGTNIVHSRTYTSTYFITKKGYKKTSFKADKIYIKNVK